MGAVIINLDIPDDIGAGLGVAQALDVGNAVRDVLDIVVLPQFQHLVLPLSQIGVGGGIATEPLVDVLVEMGGPDLFRDLFHLPFQIVLGGGDRGRGPDAGRPGRELAPDIETRHHQDEDAEKRDDAAGASRAAAGHRFRPCGGKRAAAVPLRTPLPGLTRAILRGRPHSVQNFCPGKVRVPQRAQLRPAALRELFSNWPQRWQKRCSSP